MCPNPDHTISVSVVNGAIQITNGDINVTLNQGDTKYIDFQLDSAAISDGYEFYGIKICKVESLLEGRPSTVDSNGQYWDQTCFIVSNSNNLTTLCLEDRDRPKHQDSGIDWFYCIGVQEGTNDPLWDDPKIHNIGDGWYQINHIRNLER